MIGDRVDGAVGARDEEVGAGGVRADSIAKNTAFSYATQLTTASLTALMTVFLVRALGPADYGLFALAVSVSAISLGVADAGISYSTARFVAEHRHDRSAVGSLFVNSLKLKLIVTGAVALTLALLATPIANAYGEPDLVWPLRAIAAAMFGQSCLIMLMTVASSLGRTVENLRIVAIESVLEVTSTIGLVLLGAGAAGAAFGRAFGFVLGAVIGLVLVLRLLGRPPLHLARPPDRSTARRVGRYAGSLFIVDTAYTVSSSVNVLLIGGVMGTAASGMFQAPMKLITFLQYVGLSTANGVAPRLARSHGQEPNVAALRAALRGLIAFQCVLLAPAVVWAGPITGLVLGPGYAGAAGVLAALAPYIFFSGLAPILSISVNYVGEARRRVPIALATVVLSLGLSALLIPRHGLIGAAVATDIAYGFYTLAHLWLCRRVLNLGLAPLVWSLACALTAAAAMAIVLAEIGTKDLVARRLASWRGWRRGDLRGDAAVHTRASRPRSRHRLQLPASYRAAARAAAGHAIAGAQAGADDPATAHDRRRSSFAGGHARTHAAVGGRSRRGCGSRTPARPHAPSGPCPAPIRPSARRGIPGAGAGIAAITASRPPVRPRPPNRPRGCSGPTPRCPAPSPRRPPPRPPSRPRGCSRPTPRCPAPSPSHPPPRPPSHPRGCSGPTPRCPAPSPSRPPPRPPSHPRGCSGPTPRCPAPSPRRPPPRPPSHPRGPAGPRQRLRTHRDDTGEWQGDPAGEIRRLRRPGQTDRPTRSRGSGDGETGVFELRPMPRSPARTRATVIAPTISIGWVTRCIPLPSPGPGRCIRHRFQRHGRPIRSWSRGCWPKAGSAWGWAKAGSRTGCVPRPPPPRTTGPPRARPRRRAHVRPEAHDGCRWPAALALRRRATAGSTAPARAASRCWEGTRTRRRRTRLG